jgi:hypothetical protein
MDSPHSGHPAADEDRAEPYAGALIVTFGPAGTYNVAIDDTTSARWAGTVISPPLRSAGGLDHEVRIDGNADYRSGWVASAHWVSSTQTSTTVLGLQGETPFRRPPQRGR